MDRMIVDADLARRLLERAIAHESRPALESAVVDDLMTLAATEDGLGEVYYTGAGLNRAASVGWQTKAGLIADQYDLGGGQGRTLDRSQWFDHCMRMAASYGSGQMSVVGQVSKPRGIGSIGITTGLTRYIPEDTLP